MQADKVLEFSTRDQRPISRFTPLSELPAALTVAEAATWLQLDRDASYQLAQRIGVKIGRYWRIPRKALQELIAKK